MPRKPRPPTTPPSGGTGVAYPGDNLQLKLDALPSGATLTLKPGTYRLSGHLLPRNGQKLIGEGSVYLDGNGGPGGIRGTPTVADVEVRNLQLRRFSNPWPEPWPRSVIHCGPRWQIIGTHVSLSNQAGLEISSGVVIRGGSFTFCSRYGIVGGPSSNVLIEDVVIAQNNQGRYDWAHDAGGTKFIRCNSLTLRRLSVIGNLGNGLWTDWDNMNVIIEGCTVENNEGMGIFHEVSQAASITNNQVTNNGSLLAGRSLWWGAQIYLFDSEHVRISNNLVDGSVNAIGIRDEARTGDSAYGTPEVSDVVVESNDMILRSTAANVGMVSKRAAWAQVRFAGNRYRKPSFPAWAWRDQQMGWAAWQAAGQDVSGSVSGL